MRKKTLRTRIMCGLLTLVFLASLFNIQLPAEAKATTQTIPIQVGGQTFNVTPGQWVTVNTPGGTTSYNVRFVDGKPVALEMSQYQQIVFGEAVTGTTSNSTNQSTNTTKPTTSTNTNNNGTMSWNEFQKANAGKGMTSTEMSQAYQQYKANNGTTGTSGSTAQSSVNNGTTGTNSSSTNQTTSSNAKPATTSTNNNGGQMSWNEFQKANAGKGMTSSEMSQAYQQYKSNNGTSGSTVQSSVNNGKTTGTNSSSTNQSTSNAKPATTSTNNNGGQMSWNEFQKANAGKGMNSTEMSKAYQDYKANNGTTTSNNTTQSNSTNYPKDPQTGKMISHEEAIARNLPDHTNGSGNTAQTTTTNNNGGQMSWNEFQKANAGKGMNSTEMSKAYQEYKAQQANGNTSNQANQSNTNNGKTNSSNGKTSGTEVAQTTTEGKTTDGKNKTSVGDKFKAGYETGKGLTNQGVQNVKDSLKSGFSAKNILVTAGITVGVDVATQIMRGEKPSLKKALQTVCCAEFVGSVAGSTLGAAAGSFFTPFLSCIPVVGGALGALAPAFGSVVGSSVGAYVAGDLKNGRFSIKEAFKRVDWVGVTGQAIGSTIGAALGSCLGPVGTVLGGMVGGYFGNWAAHKIAGLFGKGEAKLPTLVMPNGTTGNNGSVVTPEIIKIESDDVTSVTITDEVVTVVPEDNNEVTTITGSTDDIAAAYQEYDTYMKEYQKLVQEQKMSEAIEVSKKANEAKARYDALLKSGVAE